MAPDPNDYSQYGLHPASNRPSFSAGRGGADSNPASPRTILSELAPDTYAGSDFNWSPRTVLSELTDATSEPNWSPRTVLTELSEDDSHMPTISDPLHKKHQQQQQQEQQLLQQTQEEQPSLLLTQDPVGEQTHTEPQTAEIKLTEEPLLRPPPVYRSDSGSSTSSLEHVNANPPELQKLDLERGKRELPFGHYYPSDAPLNLRILNRVRLWLDRHYRLTKSDPEPVLPIPPSDEEKYKFLYTRRYVLASLSCFSFLAISAGYWLFALSAPYFIWFGPLTLLSSFHIILSFTLGLASKDFDFKNHQQVLKDHALTRDNVPTIDILLPVCKEPREILANTWRYVAQLKYPRPDLVKVHVLDDGALDWVKQLAAEFGFNYIRRDDRPRLKKAGNLRWAFQRTDGDFFVIYDADFCPRSDFLLEMIPVMLNEPKTAILQSPQYFSLQKEHTWVERGASEVQELFYRWAQVNRNHWEAAICVGSNAVYRRKALIEVGGTAEVGASEDVHTGFQAIQRGWKVRYIPINLATGVSPDNTRAFFAQQIRWCQGSTSLLLSKTFWVTKLPIATRMCYLSGMLYYWSSVIQVFITPIPGTCIMWFRPDFLKYYNLAFAVPSIIYGLIVMKIWANSGHSLQVYQVRMLQSYAYMIGLKDRLLGRTLDWVPSGGGKGHLDLRYAAARGIAAGWTLTYIGLFVAGCVYRMLGGYAWWNFFPLILIQSFNLYIALPFILS